MPQQELTVAEFAAKHGVKKNTVNQWYHRGKIKATLRGVQLFIRADEKRPVDGRRNLD